MLNDLLEDVGQHQRYLLGVFFLLIGIVGFLLNAVPLYIVCRTQRNQLKRNPSSRLAFFISLSDLLRSSTGHAVFGLDLILNFRTTNLRGKESTLSCWKHRLWIFPLILFSLSSAYFNCLIILDRFFRIMFIQSYNTFMTRSKFTIIMLFYLALVLFQFTLVVVGDNYLGGQDDGRSRLGGMLLTLPVNLVLFVTCIALHLKSIRMLHTHQQTICLTLGSQKILKLATVYLVTFILFYAPLLTANLMVFFQTQLSLSDRTLAYVVTITLAVSAFSSPVNAVAFAMKNVQVWNTIRTQCNRLRNVKKSLTFKNKVGVTVTQ